MYPAIGLIHDHGDISRSYSKKMSTLRYSTLSLWLAVLGFGAVAFVAGRISVRTVTVPVQPAAPKLSDKHFPLATDVAAGMFKVATLPDTTGASEYEARWMEWNARPSTRARDEQLVTALEELAAHDPLKAVALAQNETNSILRQELLRAALRGWGRTDPDAAGRWALKQTSVECDKAVAALLVSAAQHPADATRVAQWLFQEKPELKRLYGRFLVSGLNQAGLFESAAAFALTGGPGYSDEWIEAAYSDWAAHQPQVAAAAATSLNDAVLQNAALQAVISGWAPSDPRGLAEFALHWPAGSARNSALSESLRIWASTNPVAAAQWIAHLEPSPEQDAGVAAIAMMPEFAWNPEGALKWADSIFDNTMRYDAIGSIIRNWAETDPAKARKYAEGMSSLQPQERAELLASIPSG